VQPKDECPLPTGLFELPLHELDLGKPHSQVKRVFMPLKALAQYILCFSITANPIKGPT
jgi:hypothetical protein